MQAIILFATFLFLVISMTFLSCYLNAREVLSDESKLTASDYSVLVRNPPPNAYDPDEWRTFFQQFAHKQVSCVTVALNNDELVRKLIERRKQEHALQLMLPEGTDMDDEDEVAHAVEKLTLETPPTSKFMSHVVNPILTTMGLRVTAESLFKILESMTDEIRELQKKEYKVVSVFVTYETEEGQRNALEKLSLGKFDVLFNNVNGARPGTVFRDRVLQVEEPVEPDSIRWLDMSSTYLGRVSLWAFSLLITLVAVVVAGLCVAFTRHRYGPYVAGILVSVFNSVIPEIVAMLMLYEPHLTEDSYETSLYVKITLFRWVNTAVLVKFVTPLTGTLAGGDDDILPSINAILVSELYVTPLLKLMDISSNINKHFYAPRAKTQLEMNNYFLGTLWSVGERFTSLTNIVFVCLFYAALFPASFFFGAAILFIQHFVDKFSLMRLWSRRPTAGSQLARFSRRYFFYGSVLAFFVASSYTWAQFPFDNVCDPVDPTSGHAGDYANIHFVNGSIVDQLTVTRDVDVQYCSQRWRDSTVFPFPPTERLEPGDAKYMTDSQRKLVDLFGWTAFFSVVAYSCLVFGADVFSSILSQFKSIYSPAGMSQKIDFSSNEEIYGYVPQIKLPSFPFPLLACDVDDIYQGLIGWNDKNHSYDRWNMIFDVKYDGMKRTNRIKGNTRNTGQINDQSEYAGTPATETDRLLSTSRPIFSVIKHYPPSWLQAEMDSKIEKSQPEPQPESQLEPEGSTNGEQQDAKQGKAWWDILS